MTFDDAFEKLIGHEGGYSDDPRDSGNWTGGKIHSGELRGTKYGIAANTFPKLDIKNLTLDQAKDIYKRNYWDKIITPDIPLNVRFTLFDMAVNSGIGFAVKILQRALCVEDDGDIGPQTLAALKANSPKLLANRINANRLLAMTEMSGWPTFGKGWARRIANNIIYDNTL